MKEKAEALMKKAYEHLEFGEIGNARKLGKELVSMKFSGGFEILALCYLDEDKPKDAIKILLEGTSKIPHSWLLWRQLGNIYSDQKQYDQARNCYEKALACNGVDTHLISYDQSLICYREARHLEALDLLEQLPSVWLIRSAPLKASILNALNRHDETIVHCRLLVEPDLKLVENELDRIEISNLYAEMASALLSKNEKQEALFMLKKAVLFGTDNFTLEKLREAYNQKSKTAKCFYLVVQGKWNEPVESENDVAGFYRSFYVVAESPAEALEFAKDFEVKEVASTLKLNESEAEDADSWMELKGVYRVFGRVFFNED